MAILDLSRLAWVDGARILTMNGTPEIQRSSRPRLWQYFCGSSPALRVLAWLAVSSLLIGWLLFALMLFGFHHRYLDDWWMTALFCAFVFGISSFCPLGGFSAASAVLTMLGLLIFAGGGASC